MKKKNKAHDDEPSAPLPEKVIETKAVVREGSIRTPKHSDGSKGTPLPNKMITPTAPNYEGSVRGTNYEADTRRVSEHKGTRITSKSKSYPIADEDVDIYSVDTRIWDRLQGLAGSDDLHTHDAYAPKDHQHEFDFEGDFAPVDHTHPHDHPHDHNGVYSPTGHTHDLSHTHTEYAPEQHAHDFTHDHEEYADAQALADHLANHPSGGDGGSYDDSEVRALIQDNTDALAGKSDTTHTHGDGGGPAYDDSELRGRVGQNETDIDALEAENNSQNQNIQANTDALDGKSDKTHTHDTSHNHPEYFPSGGELDEEGNAIPLPYADANTLGEAVDGKADEDHTHPPTDLSGVVAGLSGTGMGLWIGSQAEYDAISPKRTTTLYVVV